ncbi:hypothetical protein A3SI_08099 [Nitritalea halalkaliphila LW7]|uniref:DUF721 domain-containing protein n=1 Tax=Nitritalea halalkaliphila LW7 TaxID=1189621 RepID=I5C5X0_9BACT|nr:DciA family protein [Nitritalea halalkaliphila]EIM77222.1 hypothetical protein A3SI_08099 [Nitritalea halalkaliphila LW7]
MKKSGFEYYKRKREVAPLEEAFKDLLRVYRLERKFEEKQLTQAWQEIVGSTVASRTSASM